MCVRLGLHFCMSYPHYGFNVCLSVRLMHILEAPYLIGRRDIERDAHQSYALGTTAVSAHFWADDLFHCYHSNVASATCMRVHKHRTHVTQWIRSSHHTNTSSYISLNMEHFNYLIIFSILTQLKMGVMDIMTKKLYGKKCVCTCLYRYARLHV